MVLILQTRKQKHSVQQLPLNTGAGAVHSARQGPGAQAECWQAPAGPHSGHPNLGLLSPEAGVTSSVMKWLHCLSDDPGGQVSLFVFNLTKIIGWLKDSFVSRELLNSHTNLLVSLLLSSNPYSHLQD